MFQAARFGGCTKCGLTALVAVSQSGASLVRLLVQRLCRKRLLWSRRFCIVSSARSNGMQNGLKMFVPSSHKHRRSRTTYAVSCWKYSWRFRQIVWAFQVRPRSHCREYVAGGKSSKAARNIDWKADFAKGFWWRKIIADAREKHEQRLLGFIVAFIGQNRAEKLTRLLVTELESVVDEVVQYLVHDAVSHLRQGWSGRIRQSVVLYSGVDTRFRSGGDQH